MLEAPNPEQTGAEFKFRIISHLELAGNCYIVMRNKKGEPIKSEDEKPYMLTTMNPGQVVLEIDKLTDIDSITGYTLRKHAVEYHYERWQVIHLKRPNPNSEIEGVGTTQCIAEWIDVHNDGMEFNRQFFLHGSFLTATIETEATDEDQIDSMRESFMEQHAGVQNSNKVLMLMKGMKLTQTLQPKDMAFDKLIETTTNLIHAGTRVCCDDPRHRRSRHEPRDRRDRRLCVRQAPRKTAHDDDLRPAERVPYLALRRRIVFELH